MRKTSDTIITHACTNDSINDGNTMKYVRSITEIIEEMNCGDDIQVGFSGITARRDDDLSEKIRDINERLKRNKRPS